TLAHSRNSPRSIMASNVGRSTKKYSRPSCSVPRGARVVYETEKLTPGTVFKTRSISVPLPPPDGELTTISIPRLALLIASELSVFVSSFNILHLFTQFLNLSLDRQARVFDRDLS